MTKTNTGAEVQGTESAKIIDSNVGLILQMRYDWFKVITSRSETNLYGRDKPTYTTVDIQKNKRGKIFAMINTTNCDYFDDWRNTKYPIVNSLPIKHKDAFEKLTNEYYVY